MRILVIKYIMKKAFTKKLQNGQHFDFIHLYIVKVIIFNIDLSILRIGGIANESISIKLRKLISKMSIN